MPHVRIWAGHDELVVALDADVEAEEAPELTERPAADARAAKAEERAGERGCGKLEARGVAACKGEIEEESFGKGGCWEGARQNEKDLDHGQHDLAVLVKGGGRRGSDGVFSWQSNIDYPD